MEFGLNSSRSRGKPPITPRQPYMSPRDAAILAGHNQHQRRISNIGSESSGRDSRLETIVEGVPENRGKIQHNFKLNLKNAVAGQKSDEKPIIGKIS